MNWLFVSLLVIWGATLQNLALLLAMFSPDITVTALITIYMVSCSLFCTLLPIENKFSFSIPMLLMRSFLTIFSMLIPFVGCSTIAYITRARKDHVTSYLDETPYIQTLDTEVNKTVLSLPFGRSGLTGNILNSSNESKRLEAVLATSALDDVDAVPILKQALNDSFDTVRSCAFGLLHEREHKILSAINDIQNRLQVNPQLNNAACAKLHYDQASLYWDLATLGLDGQKLKRLYQQLARDQVSKSLEYDRGNLNFYLLGMKIFDALGDKHNYRHLAQTAGHLVGDRSLFLSHKNDMNVIDVV